MFSPSGFVGGGGGVTLRHTCYQLLSSKHGDAIEHNLTLPSLAYIPVQYSVYYGAVLCRYCRRNWRLLPFRPL